MQILIVDDNVDAAESLSEVLVPEGHTVMLAFDGADAVEYYRRGSYDFVLMDLKMSGMDGVEATRQIFEFDPQARIAVVTGNTLRVDIEAVDRLGIVGVIRKPYKVPDLLDFLQQHGV